MNDKYVEEVCRRFQISGEYIRYEVINNGHINSTYKVYFKRDGEIKDYILQKLNTYVFQHPVAVMQNISDVTEYVRQKIKLVKKTAKRDVLHYSKTADGCYYYVDGNDFWRCCRFIDGSVTYNLTSDLHVIEESGKAFGEFQLYLADYPVENLFIVIPHFHNTVMRYEAFKTAVREDGLFRAILVKSEINDYLGLEEIATKMYKMQKEGKLPLRVTHNDTKCNNVLFDEETGDHLSVIDLDTVMPGLVAFDFGDAIRFTANTCAEDEKDLSKVALDMDKYEAFTKGFIGKVGETLTDNEKETMALGAITMTVECGVRFLTDYLNGDKYFSIAYPEHNLDRARCQLALAKDMLKKYDQMREVVKKYC